MQRATAVSKMEGVVREERSGSMLLVLWERLLGD